MDLKQSSTPPKHSSGLVEKPTLYAGISVGVCHSIKPVTVDDLSICLVALLKRLVCVLVLDFTSSSTRNEGESIWKVTGIGEGDWLY